MIRNFTHRHFVGIPDMLSRLLVAVAGLALVVACTKAPQKTEYTHVIPSNASEVAAIDLTALAGKAGLDRAENLPARQTLLGLLLENCSNGLLKQVEEYLDNPVETGIDWSAPVYLFQAPSLHTKALTAKVGDLKRLEKLVDVLHGEGLCTQPSQAGNFTFIDITEAGIRLAYNDGTLLVVYAGGSAQLQKLNPAIIALMGQSADNSIRSNPNFERMNRQNGDIRLMATPNAVPFEMRGVLNWPQDTELTGYLLFENGRIYASLQRAGFNGKTGEENQPFHPQSGKELQQAMTQVMRGVPFNIELSSEELLTLSNLRVLMEYAPDQPEVNALYQLIMQVETLNLRGDSNRVSFTVVLNEKNSNSLRQLVDFARQLAGF